MLLSSTIAVFTLILRDQSVHHTPQCAQIMHVYVLRLRVHNKLLLLNTVHNMFCQTMNDASYILYMYIITNLKVPFCKLPVNFPQQLQDFHIFSRIVGFYSLQQEFGQLSLICCLSCY